MSGSGWTAGHTIFVQIGSSTFDTDVACELTASADGTITGNQPNGGCQVPQVPAGARSLVAIDSSNQAITATGTNFTITPVLVLTPANSSAGSPTSPGVTMTVTGHGFAANSTVSGFKFDGTAFTPSPGSISTDGNGNFTGSVTFNVPSTTAGNHTVTAQDSVPNVGSATVRVYVPHTTVSPTSGAPGRGMTVSGGGWPAGDLIFVQIGSSSFGTDVVCELTASSDGTIAGNQPNNSCQVPNVPKGSEQLVSIDDQQRGVVATGTFTVTPVLVLTPANSSAGSPTSPGVTMTVTGHGFAANSTVSGFKFDGTALGTVPGSISTDSNGNFTGSVSFSVPSTTAGNHTVTAQDLVPNVGSATLRVYVPTIHVTPTTGAPARDLRVFGGGWPAGDLIFVQIGSSSFGTDVVCELTVSSDGSIAGNKPGEGCQVPSIATGSQPLNAIDDQNRGVIASGTAFTVN